MTTTRTLLNELRRVLAASVYHSLLWAELDAHGHVLLKCRSDWAADEFYPTHSKLCATAVRCGYVLKEFDQRTLVARPGQP